MSESMSTSSKVDNATAGEPNSDNQLVPKCEPVLRRPSKLNLEKLQLSNMEFDAQTVTNSVSNAFVTRLDVGFNNLSYSVKTGIMRKDSRQILKKISGDFMAGDLTAVMGPSGAGKSTLLDILAGYKNLGVEGELTVNGFERNLNSFRSESCYIMQDDRLQPLLTVRESMYIAANLKLTTNCSRQDRSQTITSILKAMGLNESKWTKTKNLSGGQRKRLAIALELLKNPPIMFFDEPTSGLDSSSSKQTISLLRQLAQEGRTIICTIHQPSALIFEMFDHLYSVVEGECVYQGSVKGLIPYLNELGLYCPSYHNPADYLLEVSTGEHGNHHEAMVKHCENGKNQDWRKKQNQRDTMQNFSINHVGKMMASGLLTPVSAPMLNDMEPQLSRMTVSGDVTNCYMGEIVYQASFLTQFIVLLKRTILILTRDKVLTYTRVGIHVTIALLIGFLYYRIGTDATYVFDNFNFLFFSSMFLMFTAFNSMILTFPLEIPIITREHFNRWYTIKSYYLAVTVADIPIQILATILYVLLTFFLTAQPFELFRLVLFMVMCVLISLVAQSIGILCGSFMNVQNGVIFGPLFILPFIIFSGFFVHFNDAHPYLRWLFHTSFLKHGFEGIMLSVFGYDRQKLDCSSDYCHFVTPSKFLDEVDMENADYGRAFFALLFILILLRLMTYFFLLYKFRNKR